MDAAPLQVVKLLEDMKKDLEAEEKADEENYDKLMCWSRLSLGEGPICSLVRALFASVSGSSAFYATSETSEL